MRSLEMQMRHVLGSRSYLVLALVSLMLACSQRHVSMGDGGDGKKSRALTGNQGRSGDANPDIEAQDIIASDCKEGKKESFPIQTQHRGLLDILVVIDSNSGTNTRRAQAAERMRPLIQKLGNSDYQVAIISGQLTACVETVITKNTPNAVERLVSAIKTGPIGSGEYVNMKAITGLTGVKYTIRNKHDHSLEDGEKCGNTTWVRPNSVVAIIIISGNAHLCCEPYACTMIDIEENLRKVGRLSDNTSQRKLYRLYGLLNQGHEYTSEPPDHTQGDNWYVDWRDFEEYTIKNTTTRLADFVKSIDDSNYNDIFNNIASDIATSLGDTFTLAETHDDKCASVALTTNGTAQKLNSSEYEISGKTLTIKRVLTPADTSVSISYSY